jgi:hypothetical protein
MRSRVDGEQLSVSAVAEALNGRMDQAFFSPDTGLNADKLIQRYCIVIAVLTVRG